MKTNNGYSCENCSRIVAIRSTVKTGPEKGKKVCPICKNKFEPKIAKQRAISKISDKTRASKKMRSDIRDIYFDYHIPRIKYSEEDRSPIYIPTRSNCCHLFAKSNHPSLQANLENVVYLTLDQHTKFDGLLFTHQFERLSEDFPGCWPVVCERFRSLIPFCEERTNFYFRLLDYLGTE